jgi:hypothetical protein
MSIVKHRWGFLQRPRPEPSTKLVSPVDYRELSLSRIIPRGILRVLLVCLLTLSGCVDFGAVKDFAALSRQASTGYAAIVDDMYRSCLRSAEFDPPDNGDTPEKHCADWKDAQPGLVHAESVLQDYLVAVGKLAGDEIISYDRSLAPLRQQLDSVKLSGKSVFDSTQVDAITGLGEFLLKAATDGYRRRQLERTFTGQNKNIQTVTLALKNIVGHDYEERLDNETIAVQAFQARVRRAFAGGKESLAIEMGTRQVQEHLWDIDRKKQAAASYLKTLDLIAKGHQELFDHRKSLGSKNLAKLLWDDTSQLLPFVQSIQRAF